ncbi:hypothetical protein C8J57DRAFT_1544894 [Mycena rebaudengoi]|nr:hypothetical protein C8J57DRAFT_1544894 [Mycena rebaudengoi]
MLSSPDFTTGIPFAPTPRLRSANTPPHIFQLFHFISHSCILHLRANIPCKHLRSETISAASSSYSLRGDAQSHSIRTHMFSQTPAVHPCTPNFPHTLVILSRPPRSSHPPLTVHHTLPPSLFLIPLYTADVPNWILNSWRPALAKRISRTQASHISLNARQLLHPILPQRPALNPDEFHRVKLFPRHREPASPLSRCFVASELFGRVSSPLYPQATSFWSRAAGSGPSSIAAGVYYRALTPRKLATWE